MIKKKLKKAKKQFEEMMDNYQSVNDDVFPHLFDSDSIKISKAIENVVNHYPEKLSWYFNVESKNPNTIMKVINKKIDSLYLKEAETNAFVGRFNKFVETIQFENVRL